MFLDDYQLFNFTYSDKNLIITLSREITEIDISDKITLQFVINALSDGNLIDRSSVVIELPPTGESCQPQNPDTTPQFENKLYTIRIPPTQPNGRIGQVKAIIPSQVDAPIIYSSIITDEYLKAVLTIESTTGELITQNIVTPGIYRFEVTATNPADDSIGHAEVILTVESVFECPNGNVVVANSLIVKKLKEEQNHDDILPTKFDNCDYTIFHVEPESQTNLFEITNDILGSKLFLRESAAFADMIVPQIQVTLKLMCSEEESQPDILTSKSQRQRRAIEDWNYVLVEDIPYSTDTTILTIIIEDVNNNNPEFIHPKGDVLLGYPEPKLVEKILPESLIHLHVSIYLDNVIIGKL